MSVRSSRLPLMVFILCCFASSALGVTVQRPEDVLPDGSAFLFVEAEHFSDLGGADPSVGFVAVDNINPIQTITMTAGGAPVIKGGLDVLPADTDASGGAGIFDQLGGGRHANTATWEIQFITPATYYLYLHASIYNSDDNTGYGNEDSLFLPPALNADPSDDWIGFIGVDQDGNELIGDSNVDGWMPIFNNKAVVSGGIVEVHNSTDEDFWDGQFHWMFADFAVDSDENGTYIDDFGIAIEYEVTEADLNKVQTFQISSREHYGAIDALVFSTSNQLLEDFTQEQMDELFISGRATALRAGDADQDLDFDQLDLVRVQVGAKYLTGQAATWGQGDWNGAPGGKVGSPPNGDGLFNQLDIIAAQQAGIYLTGRYAALAGRGMPNDNQTSLVYDATTGEISVDAPSGVELTSINIDSASDIFTGDAAQNLGGSFDNDADNNIFKATFGGSFGSISFGNVAASGLSETFMMGDLSVVGSLAGGGALGTVDLIYVPEPTSAAILLLGALCLLYCLQRLRPAER